MMAETSESRHLYVVWGRNARGIGTRKIFRPFEMLRAHFAVLADDDGGKMMIVSCLFSIR